MRFPPELKTPRLLLRPWQSEDATELLPILEANRAHLGPWIPARVANPAPVPELAQRLQAFADLFQQDREWRYAMIDADGGRLLGEVGLFPRDAKQREPNKQTEREEQDNKKHTDTTERGIIKE